MLALLQMHRFSGHCHVRLRLEIETALEDQCRSFVCLFRVMSILSACVSVHHMYAKCPQKKVLVALDL